jgi:Domain of unknown function (DUF4180)
MPGSFVEVSGIRVYEVPASGPQLRNGIDAVDLMSAAAEHRADFLVIPVERLKDDFFDLRTRIAGEIAQKFAMYGKRIATIGDISRRIAASKSLAAFVIESNRGHDLWFVNNLEELADRLAGRPPRGIESEG